MLGVFARSGFVRVDDVNSRPDLIKDVAVTRAIVDGSAIIALGVDVHVSGSSKIADGFEDVAGTVLLISNVVAGNVAGSRHERDI